jgi:hypothetical protein
LQSLVGRQFDHSSADRSSVYTTGATLRARYSKRLGSQHILLTNLQPLSLASDAVALRRLRHSIARDQLFAAGYRTVLICSGVPPSNAVYLRAQSRQTGHPWVLSARLCSKFLSRWDDALAFSNILNLVDLGCRPPWRCRASGPGPRLRRARRNADSRSSTQTLPSARRSRRSGGALNPRTPQRRRPRCRCKSRPLRPMASSKKTRTITWIATTR